MNSVHHSFLFAFFILLTSSASFGLIDEKKESLQSSGTPALESEKFGVFDFLKPLLPIKKENPAPALSPSPKPQPSSLLIWNRKKSQEEEEKVYGDSLIRWLYGTRVGQGLADHLLSSSWVSRLYGYYQSSSLSSFKVQQFIADFNISIEDFEEGPFKSFNEFFIRRFKVGARKFSNDPEVFPAFAEGRYFAYASSRPDQSYPVKGKSLSAQALLGTEVNAQEFEGGPLFIARLNPTDYHRFHFPDEGRVLHTYTIHGSLQSVNPIALSYNENILIQNERKVSILQTKNFGKIAYIEVGAMCVGKIIETHGVEFQRGEEKGYFLFGGSTVIVMGQPGIWMPSSDLLEQTFLGRETLVLLGDQVGQRSAPQGIELGSSPSPSPSPQGQSSSSISIKLEGPSSPQSETLLAPSTSLEQVPSEVGVDSARGSRP